MTREELVNTLIDWDLGPCAEAAAMLQRDGETIERLRVLVERFVKRQDSVWKSHALKHSDPLYTDCLAALKENNHEPV